MSAGNIKRDKLKLVKKQKESGDVPEEINEQEVRERENHHCIVVAVAIVCVRFVCVHVCIIFCQLQLSLAHTSHLSSSSLYSIIPLSLLP